MSAKVQVDHFRLWQVKAEDNLHEWLKNALHSIAMYFQTQPKNSFDLAHSMSFRDAILVLSAQYGLKPVFIEPQVTGLPINFPMIARDKKTSMPALLLPCGFRHFAVIRDGQRHIVSKKHVLSRYDHIVLLFFTMDVPYYSIIKMLRSLLPIQPLLVWSLLILLCTTVFLWAAFGQLSEMASNNFSSLLAIMIFSSAFLLLLIAQRLISFKKNSGVLQISLFHHLYERVFLLPTTFFDALSLSDLSLRQRNITETCKRFFESRVDKILAIMALASGLVAIAIFSQTLLLYSLFIVFGILCLSRIVLKEKRSQVAASFQLKDDLDDDLERFRYAFASINGLKNFSAIMARLLSKKLRLALSLSRASMWKFIINQLRFFFPCLAFMMATFFLYTHGEIIAPWVLLLVFGLSMLFGLAMAIIGEGILDLWFDPFKKNNLDAWPTMATKTHVMPVNIRGEMEIFNGSFGYVNTSELIIKNLNLTIEAEKFHVFSGPSGGGKTTLLKLLLGDLRPDTGQVVIDGQDLRSLDLRALRKNFGVVLEDAELFSGTVLENIVVGRALTEKALLRLLYSHEIFDVLLDLPMGLNTYIFWHLKNLSRFESAIILLARALVHEPKILFVDELLDGMGREQQETILDYLGQLKMTRILTSHEKIAHGSIDRWIRLDQ